MARTTSTQRGASRRTTRTAPRGPKSSGAAASRTRKAPATSRTPRVSAPRTRRPAGPWVPLAAVALVAVLAWSLYPALRLQYLASRRLATVEQQYASLTKDRDVLQDQVSALQTPKGVETAARKALGYAKSGEDVYIVVPSGQSSSTASKGSVSAASAAETPAPSLLQQVLDAIFGFEQPAQTVEP